MIGFKCASSEVLLIIKKITSINLTNSNLVALIDKADFDYINKFNWSLSSKGYVVTIVKNKYTRMHRLILKAPSKLEVDHIDGNKLNNSRTNLRLATHSQNAMNRKKINSRSGYKGVYKNWNRWRAVIKLNQQYIYLGNFTNVIEAAKAYNIAAQKYFGEFANLNLIKY